MGRTGTHVIVVGNEKGGSGKSTTAFHLAIYLLYQGFRVASIDVDSAASRPSPTTSRTAATGRSRAT